ncbi:MAG: hypothetical protein LBU32_13645 [Clostridiales bacterium]|jgi:hypothetical protein|nr:hypothetical protein [Clostridiales bacterium]
MFSRQSAYIFRVFGDVFIREFDHDERFDNYRNAAAASHANAPSSALSFAPLPPFVNEFLVLSRAS